MPKHIIHLDDHAKDTLRVVLISGLIGICVAFSAIIFYWMVDFTKAILLYGWAGHHTYFLDKNLHPAPLGSVKLFPFPNQDFSPYRLLLLTTLGGLVSGIIVYLFSQEAKGPGIDGVIDAYQNQGGKISWRVPIVKAFSSAITIGTGGSAGKEGPISQIGAGTAAFVLSFFHLTKRQVRVLTLCGMAAGIGAIFQAPLAAALFACEVLYKDMEFEKDVIVPAIIASIISYSIFASKLGWTSLFVTPAMDFQNPWELIPYTAIAFVVAIGARGFTTVFQFGQKFFQKIPLPFYLKPALGAFLAGCIGLFFPESLSEGYGVIQSAFSNETHISFLATLAITKIFTTTLAIGSGGSGGIFGPSVVIGGCLGGVVGICTQLIAPFPVHVGAFVIVGMAGFFAASTNTPISTIIMVNEMAGHYRLLVPTMWVCIIAYICNRHISIFNRQLPTRLDAPIELGNMMSEILAHMKVRDIYSAKNNHDFLSLKENERVHDVIYAFIHSHQTSYPVIDQEGNFLGVIDQEEVRKLMQEMESMEKIFIVSDLLLKVPALHLDDTLQQAIQKMIISAHEELFIIAEGKPIDYLSRRDIIDYYDWQMKQEEYKLLKEGTATPANESTHIRLAGIFYDIDSKNKEEVFTFLVNRSPIFQPQVRQRLIQDLLEREEIESTGIGDGVALPHPHHREFGSVYCEIMIATLQSPIPYDAIDDEPVHTVILAICQDAMVHLEAMNIISHAIIHDDLISFIHSKPDEKKMSKKLDIPCSPEFKFGDFSRDSRWDEVREEAPSQCD